MHLTVIHPFGAYKRGDKIADTEEIKNLLGRDESGKPHDNALHVIRTAGTLAEEPST